ncbi:MAG: HTTM domain-containing protein [Bacteroidota bacterium]|nr:HTTM domain-containing protein [Bacteroidota bacterium]MED5364676.1 HTTM domain-containing protein [Bacteroidota bacterium]
MNFSLNSYLDSKTSIAPLVVFRISFGLLIFFSIIRFWLKGWIETIYLNPSFHFSYDGFFWVKPIGELTYLIFVLCLISSLFVTIGYKYKIASVVLFLSYTYIELMDKTTYLNHYYLVSIISFMIIFLPLSDSFSIDSKKNGEIDLIPRWNIDFLKFMICIVYFYAGLAKINSDWLLEAQPLKIWLLGSYNIPLIGESLLQKNWVHYFMSWGGMLYDVMIPFLLLISKTRYLAFVLVIIFHALTKILFPAIGMFPYIMIISCLIFFNSNFHNKVIRMIINAFNMIKIKVDRRIKNTIHLKKNSFSFYFLSVFLIIQMILPMRYKFFSGELFWNERGYRFSWRVMLVEKKGYTSLKVVDKSNNNDFYINNEDYLTEFQEKQMSFQPDFIYEYANYIGEIFSKKFGSDVEIHVDSFVTLNGRRSERLIKENVNIYNIEKSEFYKKCLIPYRYDIKKI